MHLEPEIEWTESCTCRPWWSEFGDGLGGRDRVNWELHLEAMIDQVWRCTGRPRSSELRDALWGRDQASLEMQLDTEIEWTQRYTPRLWSGDFGDALGDRDWVNSEMYSEAVTERVWRCTCRLWSSEIGGVLGGSRFGGRRDSSWDYIHWLTRNRGNVESWVQYGPPRDERLAGSGRQSILGWCSTWCMLYSVYAVLGVNSWSLHGEIDRDELTSCAEVMVETDRNQSRWGKSSCETGTWENFVCQSIDHPRYGRYESWSGMQYHRYGVF